MSFFFNNTRKNFFGGFNENIYRPKQYTVVVIYMNDYRKEYKCIENPWKYIEKVKQNPKVKHAFIKD